MTLKTTRRTVLLGGTAAATAVTGSEAPQQLAVAAIDRWIVDLGDEDADLRAQLRDAKSQLQSS